MKINAGEIRVGMLLEYKNDLWQVLKTQHVKPGKGGAFAQVEMKSVNKNTKLNERFRSNETIEKAFSIVSLDLNLSLSLVFLFTLFISTCANAPPFPGLTCCVFSTCHKSFLYSSNMPTLISPALIFILIFLLRPLVSVFYFSKCSLK